MLFKYFQFTVVRCLLQSVCSYKKVIVGFSLLGWVEVGASDYNEWTFYFHEGE